MREGEGSVKDNLSGGNVLRLIPLSFFKEGIPGTSFTRFTVVPGNREF